MEIIQSQRRAALVLAWSAAECYRRVYGMGVLRRACSLHGSGWEVQPGAMVTNSALPSCKSWHWSLASLTREQWYPPGRRLFTLKLCTHSHWCRCPSRTLVGTCCHQHVSCWLCPALSPALMFYQSYIAEKSLIKESNQLNPKKSILYGKYYWKSISTINLFNHTIYNNLSYFQKLLKNHVILKYMLYWLKS